MPSFTCEEVRAFDRYAIQHWKVPPVLLMENAGRSLVEIFLQNAPRLEPKTPDPKRIVLCAGKGNNGGDAFVMARRLHLLGKSVTVLTTAPFESYSGESASHLGILLSLQDPNLVVDHLPSTPNGLKSLESIVADADWLVDALLGTGGSGPLRMPLPDWIEIMNGSQKPIFAVDLPSGLDGDTGEIRGTAIRARMTGTLAAVKKGLDTAKARAFVGECFLGDIGVPWRDVSSLQKGN